MKAVVRPQVGQQRLLGGLGRFGAAAVNDITGVVCVGTDIFVFKYGLISETILILVRSKVILLRGEATKTGRMMKFR